MMTRFVESFAPRRAGWFVLGLCVGLWGSPILHPRDAGATQTPVRGGAEDRLRELKIELPPARMPANTYVNVVRVGDLLYVSGTGPGAVHGKPIVGRVGLDLDLTQGKEAARRVGLQVLTAVRQELGSLDKVERLVKTLGMVNATAEFKDHPKVINGFSDLMVEVFGEKNGKGGPQCGGHGLASRKHSRGSGGDFSDQTVVLRGVSPVPRGGESHSSGMTFPA